MKKKEIGGYFELHLKSHLPFHDAAYYLNSGRSCLRYLIRSRKIKHLYVPYYTCSGMHKAIEEENCSYTFYSIDRNFFPKESFPDNAFILYTNYYGLCRDQVISLSRKHKNIIIDNSLAYYEKPIFNKDTIYSPRKFLAMPDGGILYSDCASLGDEIPLDYSSVRSLHMLRRLEEGAHAAYEECRRNNDLLWEEPIKMMSSLSHRLMNSYPSDEFQKIRKNNFNYLHNALSSVNELQFDLLENIAPLSYPLLISDKDLRNKLIKSCIYTQYYWQGMENLANVGDDDLYLQQFLHPLPIDQRYDYTDMDYIANTVLDNLK